jgi:hypothetical protein
MGQSSAATVKEIEDIRARLQTDMRELERRMPEPGVWRKRAAMVGGAVLALGTLALIGRRRSRKKAAAALEESQRARVVQVVPGPEADRLAEAIEEGGSWKKWAVLAGGALLAVQLIELRQLRRMNQAQGGSGP